LITCDNHNWGELATHYNDNYHFKLKYPKKWYTLTNRNRFLVLSDKFLSEKIKDPNISNDTKGFRLDVFALRRDSLFDFEDFFLKNKKFSIEYYNSAIYKTIDKFKAYSRTYSVNLKDGWLHGEVFYIYNSPNLITICIETYGNTEEVYQPLKDSIVKTFQIIKK
jgi:hypothetical protein